MDIDTLLTDNGFEGVMVFRNYSYDTALIGVTTDNRAVYQYEKMIDWLMEQEGWTYEEAAEWIDYNTVGANFGKGTPIIVYGLTDYDK